MASTPLQNVRIDRELWEAAGAKAEEDGTDRSKVVRQLLTAWLRGEVVTDPGE